MTFFPNDKPSSLPLISTDKDDTAPQKQHDRTLIESRTRTYIVEMLLCCALPILLRSQFWLSASLASSTEDAVTIFNALPVNSAIACFFLALLLYRKFLKDCISERSRTVFVNLLPEVFTLATILLLCGNTPLSAFVCMSLGSATMTMVVIESCIVSLLTDAPRTTWRNLAMTVALPRWMFAGYYAIFLDYTTVELQGLQSPFVVIVLFSLTSLVYHNVLNDHHSSEACSLLHLLPGIVGYATILLTLFGEEAAGFNCLVLGGRLLVVVGSYFGALAIFERRNDVEDDESISEEWLYTAMTV